MPYSPDPLQFPSDSLVSSLAQGDDGFSLLFLLTEFCFGVQSLLSFSPDHEITGVVCSLIKVLWSQMKFPQAFKCAPLSSPTLIEEWAGSVELWVGEGNSWAQLTCHSSGLTLAGTSRVFYMRSSVILSTTKELVLELVSSLFLLVRTLLFY